MANYANHLSSQLLLGASLAFGLIFGVFAGRYQFNPFQPQTRLETGSQSEPRNVGSIANNIDGFKLFSNDKYLRGLVVDWEYLTARDRLWLHDLDSQAAAEWLLCHYLRSRKQVKATQLSAAEEYMTPYFHCKEPVLNYFYDRVLPTISASEFLSDASDPFIGQFLRDSLTHPTFFFSEQHPVNCFSPLTTRTSVRKICLGEILSQPGTTGRFISHLDKNSAKVFELFKVRSLEGFDEQTGDKKDYDYYRRIPKTSSKFAEEVANIKLNPNKKAQKYLLSELIQAFAHTNTDYIYNFFANEETELKVVVASKLHQCMMRDDPIYGTSLLNKVPYGEIRDAMIRETLGNAKLDPLSAEIWTAEIGKR